MVPTVLTLLLFGCIAAAALIVGLLFVWGWRRRRSWPLLLAAVLWIGYALWEAGVQWFTPEADIRVDLLVIYPLLAIVTVLALLSLRRARR